MILNLNLEINKIRNEGDDVRKKIKVIGWM